MPYGFQVISDVSRPPQHLVDAIGQHFSADLADSMNKAGAVSREIKPVYRPMPKFVGTAVTASLPTSSFSMTKLAMLQCRKGDVLVLNSYGDTNHALLGGNVAHSIKVRGIAGVVVDGAVRDSSELHEDGLPVCARGTSVIVGAHDGPGEINVPVACGGVVVNPGDIVLADEDGIVVVPSQHAEVIAAAVTALRGKHETNGPVYDQGELPGMNEVEQRVRDAGCEFLPEPK